MSNEPSESNSGANAIVAGQQLCRRRRCMAPALEGDVWCAEHRALAGKRSLHARGDKRRCAQPGCRRFVQHDQPWCFAHLTEESRRPKPNYQRACSVVGCPHNRVRDTEFCRFHLEEPVEPQPVHHRRSGLDSKLYTEAEVRQILENTGIGQLVQEVALLRLKLGRALAALDVAIQGGRGCDDGVYDLDVAGRTVSRLHRLLMAIEEHDTAGNGSALYSREPGNQG